MEDLLSNIVRFHITIPLKSTNPKEGKMAYTLYNYINKVTYLLFTVRNCCLSTSIDRKASLAC